MHATPNQRPVMDVTVPRQQTASPVPAVAVRQAPAEINGDRPAGSRTNMQLSQNSPANSLPRQKDVSETPNDQPSAHPINTADKNQPQLPVGAILGALFFMIALSTIAIVIYLQAS